MALVGLRPDPSLRGVIRLWAEVLALRPSLQPGHDPRCAGIDEWLQRVDRKRTCRTCWECLLDAWREDRLTRRRT